MFQRVDAGFITKGEGLSLEPIVASVRSGLVFGCAKQQKAIGGHCKVQRNNACVFSDSGQEIPGFL